MRVLGIDVGGSGIKGAVVDTQTGKMITDRIRYVTPQPATPKAVATVIDWIRCDFNWKGRIGVGFPAVIKNGKAYTATNVSNSWIGTDVVKVIRKATGQAALIINDADAAALAELNYGRRNLSKGTVLFLTIGTGIGTAILIDGKLLPNTELGHINLKKVGNGERYASDAARQRCRLSWKAWASRFNRYLAEIDLLISPDLIVIGGGVSKETSRFKDQLKLKTPIRFASLQNEAGIIGAAWAASQKRR